MTSVASSSSYVGTRNSVCSRSSTSGAGRGRIVALVRTTCMSLVSATQVLFTVSKALEKYAGGDAQSANVCFHNELIPSGDRGVSSYRSTKTRDVHVVLVVS
jgi:hypothetical protein